MSGLRWVALSAPPALLLAGVLGITPAQVKLCGVWNPGYDIGIGLIKKRTNFLWSLNWPPNMGVWRNHYPHLQRLPADLCHSLCNCFDIIRSCSILRTAPHIYFEVCTSENHQKVTAEGDVIGDCFLTL